LFPAATRAGVVTRVSFATAVLDAG